MALERQSIEKKDFPIGRRGYDPDAVDNHLRGLADEVDELKRSSRRRTETLASSASDRVRTIIEAAETSAAQIQQQAEDEARDIRGQASSEAQSTRDQANAQARDYVSKVSESTSGMLERIDSMENEMTALIESLRTGAGRLSDDLSALEHEFGDVRDVVSPATFEREDDQRGIDHGASAELEGPDGIEEHLHGDEEDLGPAAGSEEHDAGLRGEGADDAEGARLIALNMALNGTPREETDRYLAENFELSDRGALLDEVYTSVDS